MGKRAVPALRQGLRDGNVQVKTYCAMALQGIGRDAAEAVDDLSGALKSATGNVNLKANVLGALGAIGPAAAGAARAIADLMKNRNELVGLRNIAAQALGAIGPATAPYVGDLGAILEDPTEDESVVRGAIVGLLGIGPAAAGAASDLVNVAQDRGRELSVRQSAVAALKTIRAATSGVVAALRDLAVDRREDPRLRAEAIFALGSFREGAADVVPDLLGGLSDGDEQIRLQTAYAFQRIPPKPGDALRLLSALVNAQQGPRDPGAFLGVFALGTIIEHVLKTPEDFTAAQFDQIAAQTRKARGFVADYVGPSEVTLVLVEGSSPLSLSKEFLLPAIDRLIQRIDIVRFDPGVDRVTDDLVKIARNRDEYVSTRQQAIIALASRAETAPEVISALRDLAIDRREEPKLRVVAFQSLGALGDAAAAVAPDLLVGLGDTNDQVRLQTATVLGNIPPKASDALRVLPGLVNAAQKSNDPVGMVAVMDLGAIVGDALEEPKGFTAVQFDQIAALTRKARDFASGYIGPADYTLIVEVGSAKATQHQHIDKEGIVKDLGELIESVDDQRWQIFFSRSYDWLAASPKVYIPLFLATVVILTWLVLLAVRPLALLWLYDLLKPIKVDLPSIHGVTFSLNQVILIRLFVFNRRVLDAWVRKHAPKARENFEAKDTVKERKVFVDTRLALDGVTLPRLTPAELRPTFRRNRCCLLIWGEGGAGKTSLSCKIARDAVSPQRRERPARHLMLPILIEDKIPPAAGQGQPFLDAVRRNLSQLTEQEDLIAEDLVERLLRRRRLLVVVDHFSELSESTRALIHPEDPSFPANALIVTSRVRESLGGAIKTTLEPLRVDGQRIAVFLDEYLKEKGHRDLFSRYEFFQACGRFSLLTGESPTTVLLLKMYATLMLGQKRRELEARGNQPAPALAGEESLPMHIPGLMLGYLDELNRNVDEGRRPDPEVHRDAEAVAWACLRKTYIPEEIARSDAAEELEGDDAEDRLVYLETKIHLVQRTGPERDRVRFVLHPLAEHLAALHLVNTYGGRVMLWNQLLEAMKRRVDSPGEIRGFLVALRECCLTTSKVPATVAESLGSMLGFPDDVLNQAGARQQLQQLVASLHANGPGQGARALGLIGIDPKVAVSALVRALGSENPTLHAYAVEALNSLSSDVRTFVSALVEAATTENGSSHSGGSDGPSQVSNALRQLGPPAVPYLVDELSDDDESVRRLAAESLGHLGPSACLAASSLAGALNDRSEAVRHQAREALRQVNVTAAPQPETHA
jgi:HEAT repeat protein